MIDFRVKIDLLKSHANNDTTSKLLEVRTSCFFFPYIQQPTRVAASSATRRDNISINSVEFVKFVKLNYHFLITKL